MPLEAPEEVQSCPLCGLKIPESEMRECFICHSSLCQYCAVLDYGRQFCSKRCRGFFFWGDGDQDEKDF